MTLLTLLSSTGDARADIILRGAVSLWERVFPQRIRGYYLSGSYANATATPTSDLDLTILFKDSNHDQAESDLAQELCEAIEALHPAIFLDMGYLSEQSLQQADRVSAALQLKLSSRPIYGEDIRAQITATPDARYVRDSMHIPYCGSRYGRPQLDVLVFPLDYPDPKGHFYGYDGWSLPSAGDTEQAGTKMLVP
jgi:predicted nucleotidyltransferase